MTIAGHPCTTTGRHIPLGSERGRKRRYEDDMGGHREKWGRYDDRRAPMYHHRMRSPPRYGPPPMDRRTDYPDYLRGISHPPPPPCCILQLPPPLSLPSPTHQIL